MDLGLLVKYFLRKNLLKLLNNFQKKIFMKFYFNNYSILRRQVAKVLHKNRKLVLWIWSMIQPIESVMLFSRINLRIAIKVHFFGVDWLQFDIPSFLTQFPAPFTSKFCWDKINYDRSNYVHLRKNFGLPLKYFLGFKNSPYICIRV